MFMKQVKFFLGGFDGCGYGYVSYFLYERRK